MDSPAFNRNTSVNTSNMSRKSLGMGNMKKHRLKRAMTEVHPLEEVSEDSSCQEGEEAKQSKLFVFGKKKQLIPVRFAIE